MSRTEMRAKTNPKLIQIIKTMGGHAFTESDWDGFAGCESEDPWIADVGKDDDDGAFVVIADEDRLCFIPCGPNIHVSDDFEVRLKLED